MKPVDIGSAYNQITHLWSGDSFDMSNGISQHKKAIQFVSNHGEALDVGCGPTGRFIELLINEGFSPRGIDVSAEMLALARIKHPNVQFELADICDFELTKKYDFITAWDSIWHIPLSEQRRVITKIVGSLHLGGVFIFSFGATEQECAHTDTCMGPEVYYSTLGVSGFINLFIELGCNIRHLELDQYPELHAYMIIQKT
ncbi:class I SAM-dependent methyltransferase [Shewanella sp. A25]|nr:class I SAM-dependent methyltransferase [Shewanella shenzhenensis]